MKWTKLGKTIIIGSFILWIAEIMYFGWNDSAINEVEAFLDKVVSMGYLAGFLAYLMPILSWYEDRVKEFDK